MATPALQSPALQAAAKSRLLRWFDSLSAPPDARSAFSSSIDRVFDELPKRNDWFEVMTVVLGGTKNLRIAARQATWRLVPCTEGIAVVTVVPNWAKGWRPLINDDFSYDTLTWYLHYARQYIHRSQVVKVLMIAWERDGRILHPFGHASQNQLYGPVIPAPSMKTMLDVAVEAAQNSWGSAANQTGFSSIWLSANTLDPNIHQGIFHFLRGQSLLMAGFEIEAVVAFDCVMQCLKGFMMRSRSVTSKASRSDVGKLLGLGRRAQTLVDQAYLLRNNFGAHPGGWRWWDQGELLDEIFPLLAEATHRALRKACAVEPHLRTIEPAPTDWARWLLVNFNTLWDVVWFNKMHGI